MPYISSIYMYKKDVGVIRSQRKVKKKKILLHSRVYIYMCVCVYIYMYIYIATD